MCSYCGCRNIPMIAQLNAEHEAIVNSSYALEIAFRDQDVEAARTACKELGELLHPHTRREANSQRRRPRTGFLTMFTNGINVTDHPSHGTVEGGCITQAPENADAHLEAAAPRWLPDSGQP